METGDIGKEGDPMGVFQPITSTHYPGQGQVPAIYGIIPLGHASTHASLNPVYNTSLLFTHDTIT